MHEAELPAHIKIRGIAGLELLFGSNEVTATMLENANDRRTVAQLATRKARKLTLSQAGRLLETLPEDTLHDMALDLFSPDAVSDQKKITSYSITLMCTAAALVYEAAYVRKIPLNKLWSKKLPKSATK